MSEIAKCERCREYNAAAIDFRRQATNVQNDYASLLARHTALAEECDNLKDHNQYLEACLEDRNAEMMRHVRMYETLREAVAWEREFDEVLVWLVQTGRYPRDMASRYDLANERECARAEVDRLIAEGHAE